MLHAPEIDGAEQVDHDYFEHALHDLAEDHLAEVENEKAEHYPLRIDIYTGSRRASFRFIYLFTPNFHDCVSLMLSGYSWKFWVNDIPWKPADKRNKETLLEVVALRQLHFACFCLLLLLASGFLSRWCLLFDILA